VLDDEAEEDRFCERLRRFGQGCSEFNASSEGFGDGSGRGRVTKPAIIGVDLQVVALGDLKILICKYLSLDISDNLVLEPFGVLRAACQEMSYDEVVDRLLTRIESFDDGVVVGDWDDGSFCLIILITYLGLEVYVLFSLISELGHVIFIWRISESFGKLHWVYG